jgi:hypothetical protein
MLEPMRTLVLIAIVSISAVATAQPIDPWANDPTESEPPPAVVAPAPPTPPPVVPSVEPVSADVAPAATPDQLPGLPWTDPQHDPPPPPRWPLAITDRPLVLAPGITQLTGSYSAMTDLQLKPKGLGLTSHPRTLLKTPAVSLEHAFGPVEVGLGMGRMIYGWLAVDTHAAPSRVQIGAASSVFEPGDHYVHTQMVSVSHRLLHVPERVAIIGNAHTSFEQARFDDMGQDVDGWVVGGTATLSARTQLERAFGLVTSVSASVPIRQSSNLELGAFASASVTGVAAFGSWDLFLGVGARRISDKPILWGELGFSKRWGL